MAYPAEQAAGADPHAGGDDQPEDASQEIPVVELPKPGMTALRTAAVPGFFM